MKAVKRLMTVILCVITALIFTIPASAASTKNDSRSLTVGVPTDRCPVFYNDDVTGDIVGIGIDLMRYSAEKAGFVVNFKEIKEETLPEAIENPEYDLVMPFGSAVPSVSGKKTVVSDNIFQTPFTLVTEGRNKLSDLNHLRVGMPVSLSGVSKTVKQKYPGIEIKKYDSMTECVDALRRDEVDALLHNSYVWSYFLQKPSYSDLIVQPSSMFSMDFRAGALDTPENRETIEQLDKGIAELSDTRRQAIILDYTSKRLYKYDLSDYIYQYWLIILLVLLLVVAVIIITMQRIYVVRKQHKEKIRQLIDQDPLTGVLSLEGFRKRVKELLHDHPDIPYLLLYTNIKDFKYINDSMGTAAGDDLLKYWAEITNKILTEYEAICRSTGDHFIILRRMWEADRVRVEYQSVVDSVNNYFINRGKENRVHLYSGIYVLTPDDYVSADIDHMIDLARMTEKRVRNSQKESYGFYNPGQWEKGKRTAQIVSHLPAAIKAGEIEVWYQPQVDYKTRRIIGAEALCRWNHEKLGRISPGEFIPTLEEAGLIHELDYYIWDRVCRDLQKWNTEGDHRSVSVNLSRSDITENRDIPGHFHDLIKKYDLDPDQLRIEITETAYVEKPEFLINTTEKLREYGFKVEMDDFGSGYSSLHMLKEVPVDRIKLDLHFLTKSGDPEKAHIIINYMVQMVVSLGMELIAEGVETSDQAGFLDSQGCNEMQGYYFYKPMPVSEFESICKNNK